MIFSSFSVSYWQEHYQFDKGKEEENALSFVDLIIINTVVPIQFAYAKSRGMTLQKTISC
jgi:hypothetical protein